MNIILKLDKIEKNFNKVHALKGITLEIENGTTVALVGENGAGKSTLMKIITGVYTKDSGDIFLNGEKVEMKGTITAKKLGIGQIYQRAKIVSELSVAENIFLGEVDSPCKAIISYNKIFKKAQQLLNEYELNIDVEAKMKNLSVASCQLVAIAKVLQRNPEIIIFDEPTSVLSENEVYVLFNLIKKLQEKNKTIIYISHRLDEILR